LTFPAKHTNGVRVITLPYPAGFDCETACRKRAVSFLANESPTAGSGQGAHTSIAPRQFLSLDIPG
jgi:hypothetical protein